MAVSKIQDKFKKPDNVDDKGYLSYLVVSVIVDAETEKKVVGYVLVDEYCSHAKYVMNEQLDYVCNQYDIVFLNAYYDKDKKELVCTMGSWLDYGKVTTKYTMIRNSIVVYYVLLDKNSDKEVGCICFNSLGTRYTLSNQKLTKLAGKYDNANFVVNTENNVKILPKSNEIEEFPKVRMSTSIKSHAIRTKDDETKTFIPAETTTSLPSVMATGFSNVESMGEIQTNASFKLNKAYNIIKKIAPYYASLYDAIPHKAKVGLGTLAVSEDTLFYDVEFVSTIHEFELAFILLHEISHIVMKHPTRLKGRDAELWNIATDLYINELLCNDYNIEYGSEGTEVKPGAILKTPNDGVFLATIDEKLDFAKDTPETIYNRLTKDIVDEVNTSDIIPPKEKSKATQGGGIGVGANNNKQKLADVIRRFLITIDSEVKTIKDSSSEVENADYKFGRDLCESGLTNLNLPQIVDGSEKMLNNHTNLTTCSANLTDKSVYHAMILSEYEKLLKREDSKVDYALSKINDVLVDRFDEDKTIIMSEVDKQLNNVTGVKELLNACKLYNNMVADRDKFEDTQKELVKDLKDFYNYVSNVQFNYSNSSNGGDVPEDPWDVEMPMNNSSNNQNNQDDSQNNSDGQDSQGNSDSQDSQDGQSGQDNGYSQGKSKSDGQKDGEDSSSSSSGADKDYRDTIGKGGHQEKPEGYDDRGKQNNSDDSNDSNESESNSDGSLGSQDGSSNGQSSSNGSNQDGSSPSGKGKADLGDKNKLNNNEKIDPFESSETRNSKNKGDLDGQSDISQQQVKTVSVTYKGKKLTGKVMMDLTSNEVGEEAQKNNMDAREDAAKTALQKMDTKVKMDEEKSMSVDKDSKGFGSGYSDLLKRYIKYGLTADVDWRRIFRKLAKAQKGQTYTLASPNKNYMSRGMTLAGAQEIAAKAVIDDIKICIDVSGSVSDEKLAYFLGEVSNIFTKYKASGELIYWSTEVGGTGDFNSTKGLLKVNPGSTGGTDVSCLFNYLSGKTPAPNGKYCKTKPNKIKSVIIITDGEFSKNYGEFAEKFGKKTTWLIDGNIYNFNPLFGKVFGLNNKEED